MDKSQNHSPMLAHQRLTAAKAFVAAWRYSSRRGHHHEGSRRKAGSRVGDTRGCALCVRCGTRSAVPAYCTASPSGNTASAYCYTSASGTIFRAVARCRYVTPSGTYDYNNWYRPWRTQGDPLYSNATCGSGWGLYQADAQTG
jgi:hypothetical protein